MNQRPEVGFLLDEMFSPAIAAELSKLGHDVIAVADRPDLRSKSDEEIFTWASTQQRWLLTENVKDFRPIMLRALQAGPLGCGLLFTSSRAFSRSRKNSGSLIRALDAWLTAGPPAPPVTESWLLGHSMKASEGTAGAQPPDSSTRRPAPDERFHPCPAGRHWGPNGAAGVLPWTVTPDGRSWVLLSHRSPHVQAGGTWSTFGGAIESGETPWHAAVRETSEEIDGIDVGLGVVAAELEVPCDHGCGWTYTTFAVRIQNTEASDLPTAQVASGHAAWETAGLAWVPAEQVSGHPGLHPGLRAAWPTLRDAIRRGSEASDAR